MLSERSGRDRANDRPRVVLVVTEHPSYLDGPRRAGYERIRVRLEALSGADVRAVHYLDAEALGDPDAVVLSGSAAPWAAHERRDLDRLGDAVRDVERPVLGICAGLQLLAEFAGGTVEPMSLRGGEPERGYMPLEIVREDDLLRGLGRSATVFQDHTDEVTHLPPGFRLLARTPGCEVQAFADPERRWWGTQFHPEHADEEHPDGDRILRNFFALAGVTADGPGARVP